MNQNSGKIALVTGASRGIGKAIVAQLAADGHYVIGTATSVQGASAISGWMQEQGLSGEGRVLNVACKESLESFMTALSDDKKLPAIFIGNAGITDDDLLLRMSDEAFERVIETNLTGNFRMTRACVKPMFRARWGRIIFIGSVVGSSGNGGQANYSASKAGLIGMTRSMAQEMGSRGITFNVVAPGFIDTDMTESLPDAVKDEMLKRIPLKRFGQPKDVADLVAFLASEKANYITGQVMHVNGGMYMG